MNEDILWKTMMGSPAPEGGGGVSCPHKSISLGQHLQTLLQSCYFDIFNAHVGPCFASAKPAQIDASLPSEACVAPCARQE